MPGNLRCAVRAGALLAAFEREAPAVTAHLRERFLGFPAEQALGLGGVRPAAREIARAARPDPIGHMHAGGLLKGADQLEHARAAARAEVDGLCTSVRQRIFDRAEMPSREVNDMQIIAQAGAVS